MSFNLNLTWEIIKNNIYHFNLELIAFNLFDKHPIVAKKELNIGQKL